MMNKRGSGVTMEAPKSTRDADSMSDDQLRALWQKTDAHATAIGEISERTRVLEYQAKATEANIQRMLERSESQTAALRADLSTHNKNVMHVLEAHNKNAGAKELARWLVPWLVAGGIGVLGLLWKVFGGG